MKVFQSFRECAVCFIIIAAMSSITMVLPDHYTEFHNEIALAIVQSEKEDKKHLIAKACNTRVFVPTTADPIFYI